MQHQSQHPAKGLKTGTAGILATNVVVSSDAIERHIAEGKRLQAEAIAAFLRGSFARIAGVFHRHQTEEGAVPHRA